MCALLTGHARTNHPVMNEVPDGAPMPKCEILRDRGPSKLPARVQARAPLILFARSSFSRLSVQKARRLEPRSREETRWQTY